MTGYELPDPPKPEDTVEPEEPTVEPDPEATRLEEQRAALLSVGLPTKAMTAFVVFLTEEGTWMASSNLVGQEMRQLSNGQVEVTKLGSLPPIEAMEIRRGATLQEMGHAASVIKFDITNILGANMAAGAVMAGAQQQMQRAQAAAQASAIMERINGGSAGVRSGLMGPGGNPLT